MGRPPACSDKVINVKKGTWTEEDDSNLVAHMSKNGISNWNSVPKKAGLNRCGKSCRPRWSNYLRANLKNEIGTFTPEEEELIVRLHATIGSRWPIIAQQLPGRTDNDVKTYWNTKLKKKLQDMGIDPITHRPFSQILADYGNISGLPKSVMRIGIGPSPNKDLKSAMLMKSPEAYTSGSSNFNNSHLVPTTKIEPMQDSSSTKFKYYQPYDLLTQLQAMRYVTEVSNSTTSTNPVPSPINFYSECSLTSSSSSTCSSAAVQEKSPLAFGWSDFLLADAFVPSDDARGVTQQGGIWDQAPMQNDMAESSSKGMFNQAQTENEGISYGMSSNQVEAAGDQCDSSFVEAMVAKEKDLFLEFPELLLEEPFYY
ncbi:transcription factor MYB35-like [Argentina anserina]|uniref:transcription factor MYB35-like n=1 Tax=Argentina anserina TaxID=57926 RepID=UPI0021765ADB|nr:transcription factor MYB35-like [Potentilla anserina]